MSKHTIKKRSIIKIVANCFHIWEETISGELHVLAYK
jgi:hypothetical protein